MQIRAVQEADIDAVTRVQSAAVVASPYYDESTDLELEFAHRRPRILGYFHGTYSPSYALAERAMYLAQSDGETVGFIAGQRSTRMGCSGELQWSFVHPRWQRRGVGTALLGPMARWFQQQNSTRVIIDAPPENPFRAFYMKHGAVALDSYWLVWPDIALALARDTAH